MKPEFFLKQGGFLSHTAAFSFIDEVFGKVPGVAPLTPTDPLQELTTLLGGEIKDWGDITKISNLYETYMMGALNQAIPNYSELASLGSKDIQNILTEADPMTRGQVPPDVMAQAFRTGAGQALGLQGPALNAALTNTALGTSADIIQRGAALLGEGTNAAQRWQQSAEQLMLPPSQNMYSPAWFTDFMAKQRASQQAIAQQRLNVAAAPSPALQALNQWVEQVGGSVVGSYLGGGMGKSSNYMTSYNPAAYGVGTTGGTNVAGFNFGGTDPYTATTGGINTPWFGNIGGPDVPYLAGNVSTPYGAGYGQPGSGSASSIAPGYDIYGVPLNPAAP